MQALPCTPRAPRTEATVPPRKHTMTIKHPFSLITLAALSALGSLASAPAAAQDDSYYYGGLGVGQAS